MFKKIIKYIFTYKVINFFFKIYVKLIFLFPKYSSSQNFWNINTVDSPSNGFKDIKESLKHLKWRNSQYLECEKNMRFKNANKKIILDYGCGPGNGLVNIITNCVPSKILAVDVSDKAIKLAKKRMSLHKTDVTFFKINENEKINLIKSESIDIIKCDGVLHHIEDMGFILSELHRILKKNGKINCMIYNKESIWYHLHVCYELKIKKGLFSNFQDNEAFRMSTDGFSCPVSKCFTKNEFRKICALYGFECKLVNFSISKLELSKLNLIKEAISCDALPNYNKDFIKKVTINNDGIPIYRKQIAGINAYFELRKF